MNFYIQVDGNNNPINHPATEINLLHVYGEISIDWELFQRVDRPALGPYEKILNDKPLYQKIDGVWKDVWVIVEKNDEEKKEVQQKIKDFWATLPNRDNFAAWTFDEATLRYVPPTPRPEGDVAWDGATNTWKERATRPDDGKLYKWDIPSWTWIEVTP